MSLPRSRFPWSRRQRRQCQSCGTFLNLKFSFGDVEFVCCPCHQQLQQSWSYEQHELTGVTTVYKAEIESVKWNFHFLTKQTILVAPWKSFQRETLPECLPLVNSSPPITTGPLLLPPPGLLLAGQCLPTWTRLNVRPDLGRAHTPAASFTLPILTKN